MSDSTGGPGGGGGPLPYGGGWSPSVAPVPGQALPRSPRKHQNGCAAMAIPALVALALVAGVIFVVTRMQANHPDRVRAERADALVDVCTKGEGVGGVPAYERGAPDQLGAIVHQDAVDEDDEDEAARPEAFGLVQAGEDAEAVTEELDRVRLVTCLSTTEVESTSCPYRVEFVKEVRADLPTKVRTELRLRDVRTGEVRHRATFDTTLGCPGSLGIEDDGGYERTFSRTSIEAEAQGIAKTYHQGG